MTQQRNALRLPQPSEPETPSREARWQHTQRVAATSNQRHRMNGPSSETPLAPRWKRLIYYSFAGVFFVLGVLGALLPGLPATPFLLLTSYFLTRSSPRLNAALLRSRIFGPILTDWQVRGGVRPAVKAKAILVVAIAVAVTIFLSGYALLPTLTVILLALIGVTVILRLPSAG